MRQCLNLSFLILFSIFISIYSASCKGTEEVKRETVLDGVVHIEEDFIIEILQVSRRCDELKLKKHRINVGDCEIYCDEEGEGMPVVLLHGGPGATHHYFYPHFSKAKRFGGKKLSLSMKKPPIWT